jgi:hypothetical protein
MAEGPTKDLLKDLPDLTVKARDRIWAKSEKTRLRLRRAQRQCLIDDPFRPDSGGRCLNSLSATEASTEYALTYFAAIGDEYIRLRKSYQQLCRLLTTAIRFVDAELIACWKGLSFDDQMTFESACLPKVRNALRDERDRRLAESLEDPKASQERPTPNRPALAGGARKADVQIRKGFVNLTDQQKDLLRVLTSKHQSNGGQPFLYVRSQTGAGVCYPGGDSLPIANDDLDFHQLRRENLITLNPVGKNQWRGKPTERGVTAVGNGFMIPADGDLNPSTKRVPVSRIPPARKPLGGIEDPPMHTVRIPSINIDDYPSDFNDTERDKIKAAELGATRVIAQKQSSIRSQVEGDSLLVRDWILPIFAVFSRLACKRVEQGTWPVYKADAESREFVCLLAVSAGMNHPKSWMAGRPIIRSEIRNEIENSPEWKGHQDKLLDLIDGPKEKVRESEYERLKGPDSAAETILERRKRRQEFLDPILKNKLMSVNSWADAASADGLAHSTVFRYYNGEVSPRIDTLQKLASPLGLKAEDLPK